MPVPEINVARWEADAVLAPEIVLAWGADAMPKGRNKCCLLRGRRRVRTRNSLGLGIDAAVSAVVSAIEIILA